VLVVVRLVTVVGRVVTVVVCVVVGGSCEVDTLTNVEVVGVCVVAVVDVVSIGVSVSVVVLVAEVVSYGQIDSQCNTVVDVWIVV
jgi:hypothetical protein